MSRYKDPGIRDPETGKVDGKELRHRLKGWLAVLVSVAVLAGGLWFVGSKGWSAWNDFRERDDYASAAGLADVEVTIPKGANMATVGKILQEAGVVKDADTFRKVATGRPDDVKKVVAGRFTLRTEVSSDAALDMLLDPTRLIRNLLRLPEGQRLSAQLEVMAKASKLSVDDFKAALAKPQDLGLPAWAKDRPEGFFFPDTYELGETPAALGVMKMTVANFTKITNDMDFENAAKASPAKDPYTAVIVASILDREVFRDEDRPKVARVIYNRLEKKMKLELDSTVAYANNLTNTIWTSNANRNVDSPYNTYLDKNAGKLPPGPISAPSRKALEAAVAPADGSWLFFVPIDLETGETEFNDTLDQHNASLAKLQAWCTASDENRKKCQ